MAVSVKGQTLVDTVLNKVAKQPFYFSIPAEDGNYRVTVTLGSKKRAAHTVVKAESRRLFVEEVATKKGKMQTFSFIVSKRSPKYLYKEPSRDNKSFEMKEGIVKIKEREKGYLNWDNLLTLEFNGDAPAVSRIQIARDTTATTVFLCGNSTVVDQESDPWASWGQMITRWFDDKIAISNHAESGLTARTFLGSNRLDKILSMMRPGDYVVCEFGHNDEKEHRPGDGPWYHYIYNLKIFVDRVREAGGHIIFCTPTQRRAFDEETHSCILNTHGDFPAAMRMVAEREQVPLIDLNAMSKSFFETLGFEDSKRALVHYPANTFPGQEKALADNTHFNPYGAYQMAKMVVMGMKELNIPIVSHLRADWKDYDPVDPDDFNAFRWWLSPDKADVTKPDGN
ncbi:MAG: rhamnogalacturonan acetylesterase [Prevotella sp.]|nr:rhamnogalacturonan acetylesterase [Prevotella sp.]